MSRIVILDSAPLGLLCTPVKKGGEAAACSHWLDELLGAGVRVIIPEIADWVGAATYLSSAKDADICLFV